MKTQGQVQEKAPQSISRSTNSSLLQRKATDKAEFTQAPPIVDEILRSPGQPLDMIPRMYFESRYGYDFSNVRIHTDSKASEAANAINAQAFAANTHIVFARDQYLPNSENGRELLAHELAHLIQSRYSGVTGLPHLAPGSSDDVVAESEANRMASFAISNKTVGSIPCHNTFSDNLIMRRVANNKEREPDREHREQTPVQVTGRYESKQEPLETLQINQGGYHIEGWLQIHTYGSSGGSLITKRITGEMISDESGKTVFSCIEFSPEGKSPSKAVTVIANETKGHLSIDILRSTHKKEHFLHVLNTQPNERDSHLVQISIEPSLSSAAIDSLSQGFGELVRSDQLSPIHMIEFEQIMLSAIKIGRAIESYLQDRNSVEHFSTVSELNRLIVAEYELFSPKQWPYITKIVREHLYGVGVECGDTTRPLWDWLHIAIARYPLHTKGIQKSIGISPKKGVFGTDTHRYRWKTITTGMSIEVPILPISVGVATGLLILEKTAPDKWIDGYGLLQTTGGISFGPGVDLGEMSTPNEFESPFNYTQEDFEGPFILGEGKGQLGPISYAGEEDGILMPKSTATIIFSGNGSMPPVISPAGGFSLKIGIGASISGTLTLGRLVRSSNFKRTVTAGKRGSFEEESRYIQTERLSCFAVDQSSINEIGRIQLRKFCAMERAALASPLSKLRIEGYASRTGMKDYNLRLSRLRAYNTWQAIVDILGDDFAIPPDRIETIAHGEDAAESAGERDNEEKAEWRRVDVYINGRLIVTLN
jgi:outer membrane protein OmpA-like peptidoglycan-associated protein